MSGRIRSDIASDFMDLVDEGVIDARTALQAALNYMNSEEIKEFVELNGYDDLIEVEK